MRSPRQTIGVGVGSFLLLIGAATPAAAADPPAVTVSAPLQRELIEWDEFTGQFWARDSVEIRARVSGYLTEIHFTDGQMVNRGDLLFVIDPRPYEATQAAAQAQLGQDCSGPARGTSARTLRRIAQEGFRAGEQLRPAGLRAEGGDGGHRIGQGGDPLGAAQCRVHPHYRAVVGSDQQSSSQRRQSGQRQR
jgi:multidrug efflux pump subunit AcrA (membrane-fusion protein)